MESQGLAAAVAGATYLGINGNASMAINVGRNTAEQREYQVQAVVMARWHGSPQAPHVCARLLGPEAARAGTSCAVCLAQQTSQKNRARKGLPEPTTQGGHPVLFASVRVCLLAADASL